MARRVIGWGPCCHLRNVRLVIAVAVGGCVGAAADHEIIADEAYAEGRFADALVEYRLELANRAPNAGLRAKAAAAAFRVGDLAAAAAEYVALGNEGGEARSGEAADGLERVANAALERSDQAALAAALAGLQAVTPGRALGGYASQLAGTLGDLPRGGEALTVLTFAAATAPDATTQDSLMLAYGDVLRRSGQCTEATPVFESLARRRRDPAIAESAESRLVACALALGRYALEDGRPGAAEPWFQRAATVGGETAAGRIGYLGLGDVRFALGDVLGAVEAYEQARVGLGAGDSIYDVVANRLNRMAGADREILR